MEQPSAPAPSENSLIEQRREKLAKLREKGIDPFKNKFTPDRSCNDAREKFDKGELAEGTRVSVAGRITAHRDMGKSIFIDVRDQSGRVQVYAQKQALGDARCDIFKHLDLDDFDEVFLVALEHGMPPGGRHWHRPPLHDAARQESIRDVILFPQLKPK